MANEIAKFKVGQTVYYFERRRKELGIPANQILSSAGGSSPLVPKGESFYKLDWDFIDIRKMEQ